MRLLVAYAATLAVFLVLDAIWLGVVARDFYWGRLGPLLKEEPDLVVAGLFYAAYAGGLVFLAVRPALDADRFGVAVVNGAVLGLIAYGTYDMTNLATLRGWPVVVTLVDIAWGTVLGAACAAAGHGAARLLPAR